MLVILILARAQKYPYLFHFKKHFRWNKKQVKIYFVKCFPIICNEVLIGVGNMVINVVLGRQSEQAIAAIAVFRTLEGMVISFFAGFSNAASVLVGTVRGLRRVGRSLRARKTPCVPVRQHDFVRMSGAARVSTSRCFPR